ncbi:unnamed protein product [Eretmochelys imbricata]
MSHKEESDTQRLAQRVLQQSFSSFSISKMDLEDNSVDALDPERLIQCPYDNYHQIRACRFPYHLIKCRKAHCDYKVVSPALRAVGNIVTGDDIQTQVILNCSALQSLLHLLSSPKESIKKEACWTISNITAGNRAQIQTVIDAHIFPALINILQTAEFRTRKEAAWAITNATSGGSAEQIKYLVELGCIKPLCDLLTVMDSKIVQVALNGLENILRLGEQEAKRSGTGINPYCALIEEAYGLVKIEFLQSHENQDIYQKAFDLIEHYFGSEDEDSSIAPQVDLSQQQYIFQQCEAPMEGFQL